MGVGKRVAEGVDPYEIKGRAVGAIIDRPFFCFAVC